MLTIPKIFQTVLIFLTATTIHSGVFRERTRILDVSKSQDINPLKSNINIVAVLPQTMFKNIERSYTKVLDESARNVNRNRYANFLFTNNYNLNTYLVMMELAANPSMVLETICEKVLPLNPSAIIYMTNTPTYGTNAASAQYVLQLIGYLGIPVIAWNIDNIGLEQRVSDSRILQLAPSVEHHVQVMLSIMRRYSWHAFSVVTSRIGGHEDFIRAIRDLTQRGYFPDFKFDILDIVTLKYETKNEIRNELESIADSEARIFLLFATKEQSYQIMGAAKELGLTGKHYVWIASQSVVGAVHDSKFIYLPRGMLGIYLNVTIDKLLNELERGVNIFAHGIENIYNDARSNNMSLSPNLSCNLAGQSRWVKGDVLYRHMRNVSIKRKSQGRPIEFNLDGTLKDVEIHVVNLNYYGWEKIGLWENSTLDIKDIVWPGDSPVPPPGVPEKFNLKITFLEEPPYVNLLAPDNETGECKTSRSVKCRIVPESKLVGVNHTGALKNPDFYKCCSGFCIDLLQKFSNDLKFTYDLYKVEDGAWGVVNINNTWNGLIADLLNHKADIVVTSIKINSDRQKAVDFTIPFLETGIAIVVAKRTGIISPKAFLEPFDTISWIMILLVCIQGSALAIFLFEWLSPYGYDRKMVPPRGYSKQQYDQYDYSMQTKMLEFHPDYKLIYVNQSYSQSFVTCSCSKNLINLVNCFNPLSTDDHKFSLFRTYWLVCAVLFGAAVNVDCPRGYTARFMSSVWAMFAVVFLAIYTANLAAFMITREEYYDLTGIDDKRLQNPYLTDPPFRYGTIPKGNTEAILKNYKPHLYSWMRKFNRSSVQKGIASVKTGELDAFIYDATVLEYLAGQDNECRLLTVGSWYAMTGYGFALPKKSKYLGMFNRVMIQYRENGDLERLQRFWLQGACKPKAKKRNVSKPLDVNQFMSAFLLLGTGILFTILVLFMEHIYFKYIRKHLAKSDKGGYLTLISLSMGKSLSFRGAVYEATDIFSHHKCKDPLCDTTLRKTREDLIRATKRIKELEARNTFSGVKLLSANNELRRIEPMKTRDMTKNYYITNESSEPGYKTHPLHSYGPHFIQSTLCGDVAEIETVL